jgi:fructokinase
LPSPPPYSPPTDAPPPLRIGVDLGGTKIESAVLDSRGKIVTRLRSATPAAYEPLLETIAEQLAALDREAVVAGLPVGVGAPGSISPVTGRMRNANSVWLNDRPLREDLEARLGRPVRVANDANCFALSEATDGAAAGAEVVFGVIIGTGCGGGVVVNRRLLTGASGVAGEWGHTPLPWMSDLDREQETHCWCGRRGCLETWLSGSGFARWSSLMLGRPVKAEAVIAAAEAGDHDAQACVDLLCDRLARALAVVIDILDPDVIVFGGGLSNAASVYPGVRERLGEYVFSDHVAVRLVKNAFGDSSGVRGAAWLWGGPPEAD